MNELSIEKNPLLTELLTKPQQFPLFQAVNLIKKITTIDCDELIKSHLRFHAVPTLRYPATAINQIKLITDEQKFIVETPFLALFGAKSLLPQHYTEIIIQRLQSKDSVLADFLNLFNHRLVALFYQHWQKHQFYSDTFSKMLKSLTGVDSQSENIITQATLFYSGFFASQHRSALILQQLLTDYFAIPIAVKQFAGKYLTLAAEQCSRLRVKHYNQLGIDTVIGQRIWDCQHHFRICLGPLSYIEFKKFLPISSQLSCLTALVRHYAGIGLTFDIQLILMASQVPLCQLTETKMMLGWNTWLKTPATVYPDKTVTIKVN